MVWDGYDALAISGGRRTLRRQQLDKMSTHSPQSLRLLY